MPIRRELLHHYRTAGWKAIRALILERARLEAPRRFELPADVPRCEQCGKPDRQAVETVTGLVLPDGRPWMLWRSAGSTWRDCYGRAYKRARVTSWRKLVRVVNIVLTVAHLNHTSGDDRSENLMAFCQWCHLNYDQLHHKETRCQRKDAARPLLELGA